MTSIPRLEQYDRGAGWQPALSVKSGFLIVRELASRTRLARGTPVVPSV